MTCEYRKSELISSIRIHLYIRIVLSATQVKNIQICFEAF